MWHGGVVRCFVVMWCQRSGVRGPTRGPGPACTWPQCRDPVDPKTRSASAPAARAGSCCSVSAPPQLPHRGRKAHQGARVQEKHLQESNGRDGGGPGDERLSMNSPQKLPSAVRMHLAGSFYLPFVMPPTQPFHCSPASASPVILPPGGSCALDDRGEAAGVMLTQNNQQLPARAAGAEAERVFGSTGSRHCGHVQGGPGPLVGPRTPHYFNAPHHTAMPHRIPPHHHKHTCTHVLA